MEIKRIVWVDYAKVIGILLVVLGHLPISTDLQVFIYSFHMPLFFFLSGFLYKSSNRSNLWYNVRSLIIPYVLLYCIYWLYPISRAIMGHTFVLENDIVKPFLGLFWGNGYSGEGYTMINIPLYFLIALFWVKLFFSLYSQVSSVAIRALFIIACFTFVYIRKSIGFDLSFSFDSAIMAFPFFLLGKLVQSFKGLYWILKKKLFALFFFLLVFSVQWLFCGLNGRVDINHCVYGESLFLFYTWGLLGIFMVVCLGCVFRERNLIQRISNGTILIVAFGTASASFVMFLLNSWSLNLNLKCALSTLGALALLYPIINIALQHFPILLGKTK